ncbi:hypothetical protein KDM87_11165 [Undibacterium sp. FT147W]|uniref:Uncharacterized protein n=1 Tax=Undibacterium rivi TaxID=2828729 RepID=A0ABS5H500_9BURK|nr:hypothetical protein [Undibacterium rivi]MBR7793159.1 hypothetical protein [Undibacterium rivi]
MTVIYRHDKWNAQRTSMRLCSALLAAGVTLLLILSLSQPISRINTLDAISRPAMLLQFQLNIRPTVDTVPDKSAATAASVPTSGAMRKAHNKSASTTVSTSVADTPENVNVPVSASGNTATDSVPLDISSQSIARAYQASKSELQQGAEASGNPLENAALSKYERLQKDLKQATIPGCTDDDALKHRPAKISGVAFIGLLAAPFWAQAAMSGKCR